MSVFNEIRRHSLERVVGTIVTLSFARTLVIEVPRPKNHTDRFVRKSILGEVVTFNDNDEVLVRIDHDMCAIWLPISSVTKVSSLDGYTSYSWKDLSSAEEWSEYKIVKCRFI